MPGGDIPNPIYPGEGLTDVIRLFKHRRTIYVGWEWYLTRAQFSEIKHNSASVSPAGDINREK